jgi:hypothetical protein
MKIVVLVYNCAKLFKLRLRYKVPIPGAGPLCPFFITYEQIGSELLSVMFVDDIRFSMEQKSSLDTRTTVPTMNPRQDEVVPKIASTQHLVNDNVVLWTSSTITGIRRDPADNCTYMYICTHARIYIYIYKENRRQYTSCLL